MTGPTLGPVHERCATLQITFVEALPKSSTGKLLRRALRAG